MRAVFMGTPDFAVDSFRALLREHTVLAAVTQPDKPKGRGGKVAISPVKEVALAEGIPVWQPAKVRDAAVVSRLAELAPDVIVVAAFGQIIPQEILDIPKYGCVNVHASLLPKYRGAAPIQWAVIEGEEVSGVTTMQMDAGLDTGDMLLRREVRLSPDETGGSLFLRLKEVGADLLLETLRGLRAGTVARVPQPKESPTRYACMLTKQMGLLDWEKDAAALERLVRGLSPWPGAYARLGEKTLKIWRASVRPGNAARPGTVVSSQAELAVQAGDGILVLEEVQLEGKKRMGAEAFLRGCRIPAGTMLCREKP